MSLIEGIGDEVTLCVTVLVTVTTLVVAWFSTRVRDRPPTRVRVIQTTVTATGRRSQQPAPGNAGNISDPSGGGGGNGDGGNDTSGSGGGENGRNNDTSGISASVGENIDTRTSDEAVQRGQYTQIAAADHVADAQNHEDSLSRTENLVHNTESASASNINDTVSDGAKSEACSKEVRSDQEPSAPTIEVLGETVEETNPGLASAEPPSTHQTDAQESSENILRNRQTGQTYPTLPSFLNDSSSHGAASSSEASFQDAADAPERESVDVEDLGETNLGEPQHATEDGTICIRVRFSNDEQRLVHTRPEETLGHFRRQNFVEEIEAGKLVRFIANGQFLADDNQTLASLNLTNNSVLHCHLSQGVQAGEPQQQAQDSDIDLGHFMVPLFGFILGFVWYFRLQYRYMFNATSTLSLVGVTVLFVLAVLAAWRG